MSRKCFSVKNENVVTEQQKADAVFRWAQRLLVFRFVRGKLTDVLSERCAAYHYLASSLKENQKGL